MNNILKIRGDLDTFWIDSRLTTKCNYACYYCNDLHDNTNTTTRHDPKRYVDLIQSAYKQTNKKIILNLFGGEPTLYVKLHEFIKNISNCITSIPHEIYIQTNLAKPGNYFSKLCRDLQSVPNFKVNCSYHNTTAKLTDFISKCNLLNQYDMLGTITVMYNSKRDVMRDWKILKGILGDDKVELSPLISNRLDRDFDLDQGTHKEIDQMSKQVPESMHREFGYFFEKSLHIINKDKSTGMDSIYSMWLANSNGFLGYKCNISNDKFFIDHNCNCYTCFNDLFSPKKPLFNLHDRIDFSDHFANLKPRVCEYCTCYFDMASEKSYTGDTVKQLPVQKYYNNLK